MVSMGLENVMSVRLESTEAGTGECDVGATRKYGGTETCPRREPDFQKRGKWSFEGRRYVPWGVTWKGTQGLTPR